MQAESLDKHTLADEFLADFGDEEQGNQVEENTMELEEAEDMELESTIQKINSVREIVKLCESAQLDSLIQRVEKHLKIPRNSIVVQATEADPEYQLIVESNNMVVEIEGEIRKIHKYLKDRYKPRFPELEGLVIAAMDYIRVVKRIGTEMNLAKVDFTDILPAPQIMAVTLTSTTTSGKALSPEEFEKVKEAYTLGLELDEKRQKIIQYVESRMSLIAPNLSTLVGSSVAAKLMAAAGGLVPLSKLPGGYIQVMGSTKKHLAGFSSSTVRPHVGFIFEADLVTNAPPSFRTKVIRVLGGRVAMSARVDAFHESKDGAIGRKYREEIRKKIEKFLEPPPPIPPKPLPVPDEKPKKRRGGRRMRKLKEKYEVTEMRKQYNRITFGTEEQKSFRDTGKTLGQLGLSTGKVRLAAQDKGVLKKQKTSGKSFGTSGATSGLSSSLAFTPVQGLELSNPQASIKETKEKYFGNSTFFKATQEMKEAEKK